MQAGTPTTSTHHRPQPFVVQHSSIRPRKTSVRCGRLRTLEELRDTGSALMAANAGRSASAEPPHGEHAVRVGPHRRSYGWPAAGPSSRHRSGPSVANRRAVPSGHDRQQGARHVGATDQGVRRRQPLLRGDRRLHPPHRPGDAPSAACSGPRSTASSGCWSAARSTGSSPTRRSTRSPSPGALDDYFRAQGPRRRHAGPPSASSTRSAPAYRDRDARLKVMDEQGLDGAFLFPTLGVGMEAALEPRPRGLARRVPRVQPVAATRTGASTTRSRIFAAPYITLVDVDWAVAELEPGARARRPGRLHASGPGARPRRAAARRPTRGTTRSGPASNEAGITVALPLAATPATAVHARAVGADRRVRGVPHHAAVPAARRPVARSPTRSPSLIADGVLDRLPEHPRSPRSRTAASGCAPLFKRLQEVVQDAGRRSGRGPASRRSGATCGSRRSTRTTCRR